MATTAGPGAIPTDGEPAAPGTPVLLLEIALAGAAAALAGTAWVAVFPRPDVLVPVLGAVAGAAVLTAITRIARVPGPLAAALHLPAMAAGLRVLVSGDASAVSSGILRGWARILDSTLPAGPAPEQRAVVPLTVWVVAAVACGLVARTRRPFAHLWPLLALLVIVRVLATRGSEGSVLTAAVAAAVVSGVLVAARSAPAVRGGLVRLVPTALSAVAGGLAGLVVIPGAAPFDLASRRPPETDSPPPVASPLALLKAAQQDSSTLFTITARQRDDGAAQGLPLHVRLTILDGYRAGDWAPTAAYKATGGRVPAPADPPSAAHDVDQEVVIGNLEGPWVPAADRAVAVATSPRPVRVDPVAGTIVVEEGLRPGDRFVVRSRVAEVDPERLLGSYADPVHAAAGRPIDGTPADLVTLAGEWTKGTISDFDRVAALQGRFSGTFGIGDGAESGRSLSQLQRFVTVTQVGTSEQFATAFVVMARAIGLPARVAVGFRVPLGSTTEVIGKQLEAWPEVALADGRGTLGWVPFDPAPNDTRSPERQVPKPDDGAAAKLAAQVAAKQTPAPPVGPVKVAEEEEDSTPWPLLALAPMAAVLAGVAGVPAMVAVQRCRRTAARRRGPTPLRVAGAWTEALEALGSRGLGSQRTATVTEAITATDQLDGIGGPASAHLSAIGGSLTRALFVDGDQVSDADADAAWENALAVRRLVHDDRPLVHKVRRAYDLRVLVKH